MKTTTRDREHAPNHHNLASANLELVGETVRLRPLTIDDAHALAQAGAQYREHGGRAPAPLSDGYATDYIADALLQRERGLRLPLAVEWRGPLASRTDFVVRWETLIVGTTSFLFPPTSTTCEISESWVAGSVPRSECLAESRLLMLEQAFDVWHVASVSYEVDHGSDDTSAHRTMSRAEWQATRL